MKIQTFHLITALLLICGLAYSQTPNWQWVKNGTGPGNDNGYGISMDAAGNCYAVGYTYPSYILFGNDTLSGTSSNAMYVVKYDNAGNKVWARKATGGTGTSQFTSIRTDASGTSYVAGYYSGSGTLTLGNTTLSPGINPAVVLAKYDANGNVIWSRFIGKGTSSGPTNQIIVDLDAAGNLYITGGFADGTIALKYDSSGNMLWQKTAAGKFRQTALCTLPNGDCFVTGSFTDSSMSIGTTVISNPGINLIGFFAKFNSSGNLIWAKSRGALSGTFNPKMSTDGSGNFYMTGAYSGAYAKFGSIQLTNPSTTFKMFIAKYDSAGNAIWAKQSTTLYDEGKAIFTDAGGNSYVAGVFSGTGTYGSLNLTSNGFNDVFVARYDSSGNAVWALNAGAADAGDVANGVAVDAGGNVALTGVYSGKQATFGSFTFTNADTIAKGYEVFIARLVPPLPGGTGKQLSAARQLSIYPNPTTGHATIQTFQYLTNASLTIYNVNGQVVGQLEHLNGQMIDFHRHNLPEGLYLIRLIQEDRIIATDRIVVADK